MNAFACNIVHEFPMIQWQFSSHRVVDLNYWIASYLSDDGIRVLVSELMRTFHFIRFSRNYSTKMTNKSIVFPPRAPHVSIWIIIVVNDEVWSTQPFWHWHHIQFYLAHIFIESNVLPFDCPMPIVCLLLQNWYQIHLIYLWATRAVCEGIYWMKNKTCSLHICFHQCTNCCLWHMRLRIYTFRFFNTSRKNVHSFSCEQYRKAYNTENIAVDVHSPTVRCSVNHFICLNDKFIRKSNASFIECIHCE